MNGIGASVEHLQIVAKDLSEAGAERNGSRSAHDGEPTRKRRNFSIFHA
jgi:hypothetical protein